MGLLRLLLALSVVLFHANANGFQLVGGGVAVESFFIISGFYMSLILDKKYTGVNDSYSLFIGNRLLKLYPAYWTVLMLTLLMQLSVWLFAAHPILVLYHIVHFKMQLPGIVLLCFTNIAILGQDLLGFLGLDKASGELFFTTNFMKTYPFLFNFQLIPQGWSLGIELLFYICAPFLLRKKLAVILIIMVGVILLRILLIEGLQLGYDPWIFRFFPSQLLLFLLGNLSYRLYTFIKRQDIFPDRMIYGAIAVMVLATLLYDYFPALAYKRYYYYTLVVLLLPLLINATKLFRYDMLLGELSYPVYLVHMLVLNIIGTINGRSTLLAAIPKTLLTVVLTLLASLLINRFVIRPIDRYRQSRVKTVPLT
jgi:peptidoglycan/LPS O-acetylase OafA/YrhL